jgi:acylphosphatase
MRHRRRSKLAYLHIRVMLAELVRWRRQASRYKLSLSEFVRTKMNDGKVRVVFVADPDHLAELKRQGENLNQLMHAINGGFPIEAARVEAVISSLQALYRREIERG